MKNIKVQTKLTWFGLICSVLMLGMITSCSDDDTVEKDEMKYTPTPTPFFYVEVKGDIRVGQYAELLAFRDDEEIWTKYNGRVVLPQEYKGIKITKVDPHIFDNSKYLNELIIPDASVIDSICSFRNERVTSIVFLGGKLDIYTISFDCKNLTNLEFNNCEGTIGKYENIYFDISSTALESFTFPEFFADREFNIFGLPCSLKHLKAPQGMTFYIKNSFDHIKKTEGDFEELIKIYNNDYANKNNKPTFNEDLKVEYY